MPGVGALGVAQLADVCAAGLISPRIAGGEGLPPSAPAMVALVVAWFVQGFANYSVAYAALGALVSRQEDLEATTAPVNVVMVAAYLGAMAALAGITLIALGLLATIVERRRRQHRPTPHG